MDPSLSSSVYKIESEFNRFKGEVEKMFNDIAVKSLNIQKKAFNCCASCIEDKEKIKDYSNISIESIQKCIQNCQKIPESLENKINNEMGTLNESVNACQKSCYHRLEDLLKNQKKQLDAEKEVEKCLTNCFNNHYPLITEIKNRLFRHIDGIFKMNEFVLIGNCLLSSELFNICNGKYITKFPFIISIDIKQYESDTSLLKNFFIPECIVNSKINPNSFKDSTQNLQKLLKSPILLTISMFTFIKNNEICNQVNNPLLFMLVNNSMNKNTCILLKYIPKNSSRIQIITIKEASESILSLLIGTFLVDEFTVNSIDEIDYLKIIEKKLKFEPINNFESISLSQNESYKENFEKCILKLNTLTFSSNAYTSIKSLLNDDVNCLRIILQPPSFVEIYPVYINKQKDLTSALTTTAFYLYKFENSNWLVFWCPDQSSKFIKFFYSYLQDTIIKLLNMCEITINYCTTIKLKNDLYNEINSQS